MLQFRNRWPIITVVLAMALALSVGCSAAAPPTKPGEAEKPAEGPLKDKPWVAKVLPDGYEIPSVALATGEPKYGGVFRFSQMATSIAPHQDPHQSVTYAIHMRGTGIAFSRLFQLKADLDIRNVILEKDVAESWKLLPDNVTYEIKIRPGVKFQNVPPMNGRELTVDDVIYSFKRQATPGWANSSQVAEIAKMEALDKNTIRITIKEPNAAFLINLASGYAKIIAKELVDAGGGDLKNGPIVGTGPWILEPGWDRQKGFKMRKNPDYFKKDEKGRQLPYLDGLEMVVIGDQAALTAATRTGQITLGGASNYPEALQLIKDSKGGLVIDQRWNYGISQQMGIKSQSPPFNDVRVRQALDKAINRQEIIDTVYFGQAALNPFIQVPGTDWAIPDKELREYWKQDIPGAKKLLAEAGYPDGLDFELTTKVDPTQSAIAELLVAQFKQAGLRAKIKPIDNPTYADAVLTSGKYQVYNGTPLFSPEANIDLYRYFYSKSPAGNTAGVNDPKLDEMIDKQRAEQNPEKRKALLKEIQWYIIKNAWYPTLFTSKGASLIPSYVRNWNFMCCYDYTGYERAWFDK